MEKMDKRLSMRKACLTLQGGTSKPWEFLQKKLPSLLKHGISQLQV